MSENKADPLLPCPFCGGPAKYTSALSKGYRVECEHCLSQSGWGDYGDIVKNKWNTRAALAAPQPAAPLGGREAILQVLDKFGIEKGHPCRSDMADAILAIPQERVEREAREECLRRGIDPDDICADGGVTAWMVVDQETRRHPIEILWRKHDLPEWFLGNGGTNTKLYALYDAIRALAGKETGR